MRKVSPNGHVVEWEYDHGQLKRQTARLAADNGNPHVTTYEYNDLGQVTWVTTPEVTYTYAYDLANRLARITDSRGNKTLRYDYSPGGQLTAIVETDANGNPVGKRSDFLYDATRRLTAITTPHGEQINFLFDAGGRLRETHLPNGISARYQYDAGNKLTRLVNRTAQGIISQHDYGYDGAGRRKTHTETIAGSTTDYRYLYDDLDRLTQVLNGTTPVETNTYDQYNNRRTRTAGGVTHYYQYDAAQQLNRILTGSDTGSEAARFQYDDNGNLVYQNRNGITRTYTYDALGRLTRVQGSDIATETYRYDHQGRRIEKTANSTTTRYHYSGRSLWAEYQNWNQALAHYTYSGLDRPILRSTPNPADTRYYHHDGLGSVVATSNAAGATQASTRFDAWGNILSQTGNTPHFGYTGQVPDATGLIHYRARYYDPALGRFTQPDPAGFVDGINPYAYVGNSPTNFTDPLGLARRAVTPDSGVSSAYVGNTGTPGVSHTPGGGLANSNVCPGCHGALPDGAPTTAADRAALRDIAENFAIATVTAATLPVSGALATAATSSRVIGWSVSALNNARNARNTAVVLRNELTVTALPVITTPTFQQGVADFADGFLTSGPPPLSPAGVSGFFISNVIDEITQ